MHEELVGRSMRSVENPARYSPNHRVLILRSLLQLRSGRQGVRAKVLKSSDNTVANFSIPVEKRFPESIEGYIWIRVALCKYRPGALSLSLISPLENQNQCLADLWTGLVRHSKDI